MRREFTAKVKVSAFERAKGRCECCGARLFPGNIEYDHEIPCAFAGDASIDNIRCVCRTCHRLKTSTQDVPAIAKSNRIRRRHMGIKKQRTIRGGRGFNGRVIRYE